LQLSALSVRVLRLAKLVLLQRSVCVRPL
jgi:hypothetical protein